MIQTATGNSIIGQSASQLLQINEPTISGRLAQIRESMDLAEQRAANLRGHLFGEVAEDSNRMNPPSTVRGIVDDIGTRLACLCGSLIAINQRVGCAPEPNPQAIMPQPPYTR